MGHFAEHLACGNGVNGGVPAVLLAFDLSECEEVSVCICRFWGSLGQTSNAERHCAERKRIFLTSVVFQLLRVILCSFGPTGSLVQLEQCVTSGLSWQQL